MLDYSPTSTFKPQNRNGSIVLPTSAARSPSPNVSERWHPKNNPNHNLHSRSISNALGRMRNGRARSGSASAAEIVTALKAPVSPKLVALCLIWYLASALSNTSSKSILNAFPKPVTLTLIQFAFVSSWCVMLSLAAQVFPALGKSIPGLKGGLRYPTRKLIATTAPLAIFQVGGHIFSSIATSKIPVSLVHTIKGMSPLFTVGAYRFIFHVHYSAATYLSLIPLTVGVMLACSIEFRGNFFGILCAFGGAIVFVSQNIFSKKLFNESSTAADSTIPLHQRKLDKVNLLCYSSGMAFLFTAPLWLYSEGFELVGDYTRNGEIALTQKEGKHGEIPLTGWGLIGEFFFNGAVNFGQGIIAFVLLSMVSTVTYSVASLIKRIFVIVVAIVWFGNKTTNLQAVGITLTFFGLYLYDRAGDTTKADRQMRMEQTRGLDPLLPVHMIARDSVDQETKTPQFMGSYAESPTVAKSPLNGYAVGHGTPEANGNGWLPGN